MDLNCNKHIVSTDYVNTELFEKGYHFTRYFVPPNEHIYRKKSTKKTLEFNVSEFIVAELSEIDNTYDNTGYDVIFTVDDNGHQILAHRKKLASESVYFDCMFSGYFLEANNTCDIKIHGVSAVALRKLVTFCYTKCIRFELFDVEEIVSAANLMLFDDIVDEGLKYLKSILKPQNCLNIYTFAQEHNFENLTSFAMKYAKFYFSQVSKTSQFLEISFELLIELIKTNDAKIINYTDYTHDDFFHNSKNILSPFELLYGVLEWIKFDEDSRKSYIFDLLTHIPFAELQRTLIKEHITYFENLSLKYDRETFRQFECDTLNRSDPFDFIMFKTTYYGLKAYCPVLDEFRLLTKFDHNIRFFGQCQYEDKIILAGGLKRNPNDATFEWLWSRKVTYLSLQNFKIYDLPSMKMARRFPGVAVLDNAIYVCGGDVGIGKHDFVDCVERYDLVNKRWTSVTPMINRRADFFMCAIRSNRLYAIGGTDMTLGFVQSNSRELSVECYDSQKNEWNIIAKLEARGFFKLPNVHFVFNNIIHSFVMCGPGHPFVAKIFKYDEDSNSWILVNGEFNIKVLYHQKYPLIHCSEDNTLIIGAHTHLPGISGSCFVLYKVVSGNCQPISAPWRNRFSVSKKILARNSILRPEEFRANSNYLVIKKDSLTQCHSISQ